MHRLLIAVTPLVEDHRLQDAWASVVVVLSCSQHAPGSSWLKDQTRVSCIGRQNLLPLSHQGSPHSTYFNTFILSRTFLSSRPYKDDYNGYSVFGQTKHRL